MCNTLNHNNSFLTKDVWKLALYLAVCAISIGAGLSSMSILHESAHLVAEIFIRIFKFLSLPIIMLSLISVISQQESSINKMWKSTIFYTATTTTIAGIVAFIVYKILSPRNIQIIDNNSSLLTQNSGINDLSDISYIDHIINIVPSNLIEPILNNQIVSVLMLAMIFGVAIRLIPNEQNRHTLVCFFQGLYDVFILIGSYVVKCLPLALFGFMTTMVVQLRNGYDFTGIMQYITVILLANLIQGFVILPLILKINKLPSYQIMRRSTSALLTGFFSKSSTGTLPVTMAVAEKQLGISPRVAKFVLPICTTINMNGCAAFIFTTVVYVMQNNGYHLTTITMLMWVIASVITAIGNAGVPMGCFFMSMSILSAMNVPIAIMGVILPLYTIIDMLETSLNIWSDISITSIIHKKETDGQL